MSGKKDPNLGAIQVGSTRGEVELHLKSPIKSTTNADGTRTDIYQYEIGNEPSAGRAIGHGIMDLCTWGLWEVVGTPIEGFQGDKFEITLVYDEDDTVQAINNARKIKRKTEASTSTSTSKIKLVGLSDNASSGEEQDRKEAILDAKTKVCEQAGIDLQFSADNNPQIYAAEIETEAEKALVPNYQIVDVGYQKDQCTYQVLLIGEIIVPKKEGASIQVK